MPGTPERTSDGRVENDRSNSPVLTELTAASDSLVFSGVLVASTVIGSRVTALCARADESAAPANNATDETFMRRSARALLVQQVILPPNAKPICDDCGGRAGERVRRGSLLAGFAPLGSPDAARACCATKKRHVLTTVK